MKLIDSARVIRSKNAGPTQLTIDILFDNPAGFERARQSDKLSAAAVAACYGLSQNQVRIIPYPAANALKIVMDRAVVAGTPGDRDVYGAQQHGPLLDLVL
ncbi:MAG: DUF4387 domain-containing protein [Alphaproteobacteria bacterium]|jgi:hypothetical protein|nr:DUF4387 domain-containing protein [Alphaproteobacteria bacterium]